MLEMFIPNDQSLIFKNFFEVSSWKYDREGDTRFFSFLGFFFICADIFLYVDDFLIIENESSFRSLPSISYETDKSPSIF